MINFKVDRKEFLKALQNVGVAVRENRIMPSISGIYLDVKETSLEVRGTDLEMTVVATVKAEILSPGIALIKSNALLDYLKEIDDQELHVQQTGHEIIIKTSKSLTTYAILDYTDYPDTMHFDMGQKVNISAKKFSDVVEKIIVGASATPDNLAVHCVRLDITKDEMRLITSDTYRMFLFKEKIASAIELKASIPLKTVSAIVKIIRNSDAQGLTISLARNLLYVEIDNVTILSKLIDLPYPDYESILSSLSFEAEVLCQSDLFKSTLRRALIFARENSDVRNAATFNFSNNTLSIEAISEQAKVKESIDIIKSGPSVRVSLNVKYLLDFVDEIDKNIVIKLKNSDSAILLTEENNSDFVCLTMPLSLS